MSIPLVMERIVFDKSVCIVVQVVALCMSDGWCSVQAMPLSNFLNTGSFSQTGLYVQDVVFFGNLLETL